MKVLMINVVCGIRSTGRICTDLATVLEAQGHEVMIAYGREEVPDHYKKYAIRIGSDIDVKLHGLKARVLDGCGFGSKIATERFISWVKEYDPDVIHLHNLHGYYLNIEVLFNYLRTCGKKIVWTLHDCWAFTGHSAYCDAIECNRWIDGCYDCPIKKEYPKSIVDFSRRNWTRKKALMGGIPNMYIVTPSEWLAGLVKKSYLSQYPITVIHNGIDTTQFYPIQNEIRDQYKIGNRIMLLGVATSWNKMKGFFDYIELANLLNDNYCIVLVGLTEAQIKTLPGNIIGIERTNSMKELAQFYSAADLFLNLSYCENYPTVNLESIACGTPVLTYRTGGSPESAYQSSIIVERGDVKAVAETIMNYKRKKIKVNRGMIDYSNTVKKYISLISGNVGEADIN